MRKMHLSLHQQLDQFETEQEQIAQAILEVQRRIAVLDEVMSWSVPGLEAEQEFTPEFEYKNGDAEIPSMGL